MWQVKIAVATAMTMTLLTTSGAAQNNPRGELEKFANDFLAAIADADWAKFRRYWAEDAVMYAPAPTDAIRLEGLVALEREWRAQFEQMRLSRRSEV